MNQSASAEKSPGIQFAPLTPGIPDVVHGHLTMESGEYNQDGHGHVKLEAFLILAPP